MNSCPKIISSDLANHKSQKGEKLQKNPKRIYVSLTNEATKLKTQLKEASTNIKDYLDLCYYNSGNLHPQACEKKDPSDKNHTSNCLVGKDDLEITIDELFII